MFCKNCGSPVAEGAATCPFCGVAMPRPEARSKRIYVRPDFCCLCGKPLTAGHAVLFTYQSGDEARVDQNCCNMLSALYDKENPKKMQMAVNAIRARMPDLDPAVADHLQASLRQADEFLSGKAPEQQRFTREVTQETARKDAALRESKKRRKRRGLKVALILTLAAVLVTVAVLIATGVIPLKLFGGGTPQGSAETLEVREAVDPGPTAPGMTTLPPPSPTPTVTPDGPSDLVDGDVVY